MLVNEGGMVKAVVLQDVQKLRVQDVEKPVAGSGEVVVRVELAGVCGSDSSLYRGKCDVAMPVIPGHECVGVLEEIGNSESDFEVGQRVVIHPNLACGSCAMCLKGLQNICENKIRVGLDANGVFAEYVKVPETFVFAVPESLSNEEAVFAEPLAVALHGIRMAVPKESDNILVYGAGVIGQLVLQIASLTTKNIVACDLSDSRLEQAEKFGAIAVKGSEKIVESYSSHFDIVYETSGAPAALNQAIDVVAPGGTIVLFGLPAMGHEIKSALIVRKEIKILGSIIYRDEFPAVIELLDQKKIETAPLITSMVGLEKVAENLEDFYNPNRLKTLVKI